ncbi:LysR family transcriptional regulator [Caballeronia sp. 15711]|uniref:LysR family transcriptional regulator n=1 Tax=Caballeronia sp. 15711 TaxID=3391029 RepID=UPI0039E34DD8
MFSAAAEAKGFSAAVAKREVSPSTVSQAVRQLETRLWAPLFHRTTRNVALSDAGSEFLERIGPALQTLNEATEALGDANARPSGALRLNARRVAYLFVLQPVLSRYIETYPDLQIEVVVDSAW